MRVVVPHRTRFARALHAMLWGASALLLGSCGGSTQTPPGTPVVTMGSLDNSGDFTSYIIAIDSITLTRNDGTVVTPLVTPQTVDLAKLNAMTELVEAPAVPSGTYTKASVTLDYSSPSIVLNLNGHTAFATPQNISGTALLAQTVTVTFDPGHPLVVNQGQSVRLHVDVDLAASNTITATNPAVVQVQPFAVITPAPADSTVLRSRGLFVVAQSGSSNFVMNTRPFYDLTSALGALTVNVNAQTYYNVNGQAFTGEAGLAALAVLQINTPIAVYGTLAGLSGITPSFNATSVYAGTSQESYLADYLTGVVSARSGDTLTLRAVNALTPTGVSTYLDSIPVGLGSNTIVSEDGVAASGLTPASVSVGQRINVSGQAKLDPTTGALLSLDASAGQVRLMSTPVWGTLNSATAGSASLDVAAFDGLAPSNFSFAGTGAGGQDAVPATYQVSTGAMDQSAVAPNTLLQVNGLVTPFGAAPPDFAASAITVGAATQQTLVVEWSNGGSTAPFTSATSAGLVVNLADPNLSTSVRHIRTGPVAAGAGLDLTTLPASPLITTTGADPSNLQLAVGSIPLTTGISVFNSAAAFATGLASTFNGTNKIYRLVAYGQYNSGTNTFVASRIHVALHE
jgi:hypothetical protein